MKTTDENENVNVKKTTFKKVKANVVDVEIPELYGVYMTKAESERCAKTFKVVKLNVGSNATEILKVAVKKDPNAVYAFTKGLGKTIFGGIKDSATAVKDRTHKVGESISATLHDITEKGKL